MSGFFGMLREDGAAIEDCFLRGIAEELRFRGPDGVQVWSERGIAGCFVLMRVGPAAQAEVQPVEAAGRFKLIGDVRVDGREELRQQLLEEGYGIDSDASSEEYFLSAWHEWGEGALQKVIGDFSVAVWDAQEHTLWCARDFVGPRPFFYAQVGPIFCFSNTLDVLRRVPGVSAELDEDFMGDFLLEGWSMELSRTVYRDIRRLPPGHVLKLANGKAAVHRFRKLPVEEPLRLKKAEEYVENYLALLKTAVKDRLPKGRVALYLSGGMDSSAVSAMASQAAKESAQKISLKAFTTSWNVLMHDDEPELARLTARHLGIPHEIFEEAKMIPFESGENGEGITPEPTLEPFFAREQRQYRKIAAHSNVVLSGDGGDDVLMGQAWPYLLYLSKRGNWKNLAAEFGGYLWKNRRIPPLGGGFRTRLSSLFGLRHSAEYPTWLNENFEVQAKLRERWRALREQKEPWEHPVHPRAYTGLHGGYWGTLLETEDAGWSRVNLESRAPLLDLRILRFSLRLPTVPWCMEKELCRRAMRNYLPAEVVERPKTPLAKHAVEACAIETWKASVPRQKREEAKRFVNIEKWCETLNRSKGSLSWLDVRPLGLLKWFESH